MGKKSISGVEIFHATVAHCTMQELSYNTFNIMFIEAMPTKGLRATTSIGARATLINHRSWATTIIAIPAVTFWPTEIHFINLLPPQGESYHLQEAMGGSLDNIDQLVKSCISKFIWLVFDFG